MNRFAFGLSLLGLGLFPLAGGCGLYITAPPEPEPAPKPPPKPLEFPFDPAQGTGLAGAPTTKGFALNGAAPLPTKFRTADVIFAPKSSNDLGNYTPLLVLQSVSNDAKGNPILGAADVLNPVRLAGVIVPAPNTPGYEECLQAIRNWAQGQPAVIAAPAAGATPSATAKATATPARPTASISVAGRAGASATATPIAAYIGSQDLDVFEDPKYPIDSENRRLVQVFFNSTAATPTIPTKGTPLSLNRMLIRSGWAVVDLYSPTSFDQQSWLLDESYARLRKLGLWKFGVALQQRAPVLSTGTGAQSSISVTAGTTGAAPPRVPGAGKTVRGATPLPGATVLPTPSITVEPPRLRSGTNVVTGRTNTVVLPPPAPPSSAPAPAAPAPGGAGNTAAP